MIVQVVKQSLVFKETCTVQVFHHFEPTSKVLHILPDQYQIFYSKLDEINQTQYEV